MRKHAILGLIALAANLWLVEAAQAGAIFDFVQTGGNVIGTLSGSLDVTGLGSPGAIDSAGTLIQPDGPQLFSGTSVLSASTYVNAFTTDPLFGPGDFTVGTSTTGDRFAIVYNELVLPPGYLSGTALTGSLTFAGASFASLGITPGTYSYTLPNDTVTLRFGAVPEPATLALLGLGLTAIGWTRRKAKR